MRFTKILRRKIKPWVFLGVIISTLVLNLILILRSSPLLTESGFGAIFPLLQIVAFSCYPLNLLVAVGIGRDWERSRIYRFLFALVAVIPTAFVIISFYFNFLESSNYPNFVFSKYFIYLPSLQIFTDFQLMVLMTGILSIFSFKSNSKLGPGKGLEKLMTALSLMILSVIVFNNLSNIPKVVAGEIMLVRKYVFTPKNQQNPYPDLGDFYQRISFVRDNTEADSIIVHPTQSNNFATIGNQPLIRHDLFPRTLVTISRIDDFYNENQNFTESLYYIVAKAEIPGGEPYFPNFPIKARSVKILFMDGSIKSFENIEYNAQFIEGIGEFRIGIIELKK